MVSAFRGKDDYPIYVPPTVLPEPIVPPPVFPDPFVHQTVLPDHIATKTRVALTTPVDQPSTTWARFSLVYLSFTIILYFQYCVLIFNAF